MTTGPGHQAVLYTNATWNSPYVLSAFVGLTEKKLPFEVQEVALHEGAQRAPAYVETSFTARVPALVDGAFSLSESSAIVEYLEDKWPPPATRPLLPRDLEARARARQIMAWVRSDLMPIREERSAEYVFYPHDSLAPYAPLSPAALRALEKLVGFAGRIVPADGGPLFGALVDRRHRPRDDAAAAGEDQPAAAGQPEGVRRARVAAPVGAGVRERAAPALPARAGLVDVRRRARARVTNASRLVVVGVGHVAGLRGARPSSPGRACGPSGPARAPG